MNSSFNVDHIFTYHVPKNDQPDRYLKIREAAKDFAAVIIACSPSSAEQTLALRDLQRCVMMANAAIAVNE